MRIVPLFAFLLVVVPSASGQSSSPADTTQQSLALAHKDLEQGQQAEAIALLQKLAAIHPPVKGLQHELGIAYYRTGKLLEAQRAFAAAIQEDSSDAESVQMQGLTLYRLGRPADAIPYLERVREWTPNSNADANYVLGLCYMNAQRYDDARRAFATGFKVNPDSGAAYLLLGSMLQRANLEEFAAIQAQKALQLAPNLPLAHFLLGEVYLFKSDVDHALQEFEKERLLNPGYAPVYDRLGDVYTRTDRLQDAQEALTKAISLDTSSTGSFIQMGKVLLRRQDPVSSIMYLKHAEKMDPANFITHTLLAQAYRKVGQEDEAKQEMEMASKIHVENQLKLQPIE
ncbi:tetratricopeptide repeat protein [Acidobacterium sp. S8]|uniref:tetratricopeptide repeat protein n=1 Tax=Acidobacterium sp. S8 TaxID=1641854 RepID=UPI00131DDE0F|nr:tetratricopeptide repeat protein [Acidobacterium sp. S8]